MNIAALRETPVGRRFRFDGVLLDEAAGRLFVDGRERLCSQRALRLLLVMCESAGQVMPKQRVIDKLWPGGQVVSDEALTQVVFRARACLDSHADRLVTVRGVGLRLDAEVRLDEALSEPILLAARESEVVLPPAAVPADTVLPEIDTAVPAAPPLRHPKLARSLSWRRFAGMLIALAALLGGLWAWQARNPDLSADSLDVGWGLVNADAHASRSETLVLLREAFEHEGGGDRARAAALLETAHASDPATPLPAMFLALWAIGSGDATSADRWLGAARQRMQPVASPLLTALLRYVEAEQSRVAQDILRYAGAVLDQREQAWQLRVARAHLLLGDGLREAALKELLAVSIDSLAHRKLAMALADRASLGDPDGAEAVFARLADSATEESTRAFLRGRFAWTRADYPAAARAFEAAADAARKEARFALAHRATVNRGVIAMQVGDRSHALRWLEQARTGMAEGNWVHDEIDISLILAQLHALDHNQSGVEAELTLAERAAAGSNANIFRDLCKAFRARLAPDTPIVAPEPDSEPALAPLLAAHVALRAGDRERARAAWKMAKHKVEPTSPLHDEIRWLAAALGETVDAPARIDPPYPPLARLATRLAPPLASLAELENAP
jgi:DNA-binding winged helix-turn-helix (wHTH) protein/tetratricopeptide (TPR) repeat protein